VLQLASEQLVVATPNAALATKLKQQLPKLIEALQKRGWQITAIRIKVQVSQQRQPVTVSKQCQFSDSALSAFSSLEQSLAKSSHNDDLCLALRSLLSKYPR
jgi:chromosomal replication initiation ATPase DnaA